jgi:hypothetical protein
MREGGHRRGNGRTVEVGYRLPRRQLGLRLLVLLVLLALLALLLLHGRARCLLADCSSCC